jgi:SAM-dependent methyltransferase
MGEFYELLKEYNNRTRDVENRANWHEIYCNSPIPIYLNILLQRLSKLDKNLSIIEVGSGYGDVVAMLLYMGFKNIIGIDRDKTACALANKKLQSLFKTKKEYIMCDEYPVKLDAAPDIYIQINNVYVDSLSTKEEYLKRNKEWIQYNGIPRYSYIEFIDESFKQYSKHFPSFIRLSKKDIEQLFHDNEVNSFKTYEFPVNTSSKCLYEVKARCIN